MIEDGRSGITGWFGKQGRCSDLAPPTDFEADVLSSFDTLVLRVGIRMVEIAVLFFSDNRTLTLQF